VRAGNTNVVLVVEGEEALKSRAIAADIFICPVRKSLLNPSCAALAPDAFATPGMEPDTDTIFTIQIENNPLCPQSRF